MRKSDRHCNQSDKADRGGDEVDPHAVKARALKGAASLLLARLVLNRFFSIAAMLVLAKILTPEDFGVFAIAQFLVVFFEQISNMGLSGALLRKKSTVTDLELRTVFTVQQLAIGLSIVIIVFGAPYIVKYYNLDDIYSWLIRAIAAGLLLASLKTIPSIVLERQFKHNVIATSEVCEHFSYHVIAVGLALLGFGVWALVCAFLIRGLLGVFILYSYSWWKPALGFDWKILKEIMKFGIPILFANLVELVHNSVVPIFVGSYLGATAVGLAHLSRVFVDAAFLQPLMHLGQVQMRILSRIQDDRDRLSAAIERSLYHGAVFTCFLGALLISQIEALIDILYGEKWAPIVVLVYVLGAGYILYILSVTLIQALKALGDAKTLLYGNIILVSVQILSFVCFVDALGLVSFALSVSIGILCQCAFIYIRLITRVQIKWLRNVFAPVISGILAGTTAFTINMNMHGLEGMIISILVCGLIYVLFLGVLSGVRLKREVADIVRTLKSGGVTH